MNNQKGTRWIAAQVLAAFEASRGGLMPVGGCVGRVDVDGVVAQVLEEALDRLGGEGKDFKDIKDPKG